MKTPRTLLLVDAAGAATTALATYLLLASGRIATGLPTITLQLMALAAACFSLFDLTSFALGVRASAALPSAALQCAALRIVAALNLSYAALTAALLIVHRGAVTPLGWGYFGIESAVLVALALWEFRVASAHAS